MKDRLRGVWRRMRALVARDTADRELADELRFHQEMETEALLRRGVSPADARRMAVVMFGGADRFAEASRDARGAGWLDAARQDARLALRLMRTDVQLTAAVVLTLALGIGANTAIFSVVDAVLLRASPFADPHRLVMVWQTDRTSGTEHEPSSWPDLVDLRERARSLESLGAVTALDGTVQTQSGPARVAVLGVTDDVPALLGVKALVGRAFGPGDEPGVARVLLSERYWRSQLGAARDAVGTTLTLNGMPTVVMGVLADGADLGIAQIHASADYAAALSGPADVWLALAPTAAAFPRHTHPFLAVGRLHPDVTVSDARAELSGIMAELEAVYPENAGRGINLEPLDDVTFGGVRQPLFVLLCAVLIVLLVACVNVANLLLARGEGRSREVAVRGALGASPARIRRQFVVESMMLTAVGAALGVALAHAALDAVVALAPADVPRIANADIDGRVLAFVLAMSVLVSMLFGLAPSLQARRIDLQSVLKSTAGRSATMSRESRRYRESLVVAEVALAVVLLVSAGLLLRSLQALNAVDPGFRTNGIVTANYQLDPTRYPMDFARWPILPEINAFHETFLERAGALPGVHSAALAAQGPLDAGITNSFIIAGRESESADLPEIRTRFITPGYLETLGVPLIAGREFRASDVASAPRVAVVNAAAAARYFAGTGAVGQSLGFWGVSWQIVGVIGDERFNGLDAAPEPAIYTALAQAPQPAVTVLLRSDRDPQQLATELRRILRDIDPGIALSGAETLDAALGRTVARPQFVAVLLGLFAAVAAGLAIIGVHGLISYGVARRKSEIGIRMALGAERSDVLRLIVREAVGLVAAGVMIGVLLAAAAGHAVAALLFGVRSWDPLTFTLVISGMLACALLASLSPAWRAARAAPMSALRAD